MKESNRPENCNECEYSKTCKSHYGGVGCKHQEAIEEESRRQKTYTARVCD